MVMIILDIVALIFAIVALIVCITGYKASKIIKNDELKFAWLFGAFGWGLCIMNDIIDVLEAILEYVK